MNSFTLNYKILFLNRTMIIFTNPFRYLVYPQFCYTHFGNNSLISTIIINICEPSILFITIDKEDVDE